MSYRATAAYTLLFHTTDEASRVMSDLDANSEPLIQGGRTEGFRLFRPDAETEMVVRKASQLYHEKRVVSVNSPNLWLNPDVFLSPNAATDGTRTEAEAAAAILSDLDFLTTQPGAEDASILYGHSSLDPYSIVGWSPVNKALLDKLRSFVVTHQG